MTPGLLITLTRQQVQAAHDVARIEVVGVDPGLVAHGGVFRSQFRNDHLSVLGLHVREQTTDQIADHVGAQGPACPEIAEDPGHIGHATEHHATPSNGLGKIQRLAINAEVDVAQHIEIEACSRHDHVSIELRTRFQLQACGIEGLDLVGHHRCLTLAHALKKIAIRDEGDPLFPGLVVRCEMLGNVEVFAQEGLDPAQQLARDRLGLCDAPAGEEGLIVQDFPAHDFVDPFFLDVELAQRVGQHIGIAPGDEEGGRALQHRDMLTATCNGRHHRGGRGARADHHHFLAGEVEPLRPSLRMNDAPLEAVHARPLGRIPLAVAVIALAHPQEPRLDLHGVMSLFTLHGQRP